MVETTDPGSLLRDGAYETLRCRLDEAVVQTTVISNALGRFFHGRGRDSRNKRSRRADHMAPLLFITQKIRQGWKPAGALIVRESLIWKWQKVLSAPAFAAQRSARRLSPVAYV